MNDAKKNQGYILPDPITGWDLICVTLKIPDTPQYRAAFRGALQSLTEWHNWERTGDTKGAQAATYWRQLLHDHLRFMDCYDLGEEIGDVSRPRLCKYINPDGTVDYKISYNDGCTWEVIELCDDSQLPNPEPDIPVDPVDDPGNNVPDPDIDVSNATQQRCNIVELSIRWFLDTRISALLNAMADASASELSSMLLSFLDATTEDISDYFQFYPSWKRLIDKYYPDADTLLAQWEDESNWTTYETECFVFECLPSDLKITRGVLDCIADKVDNAGYGDKGLLQNFLVDYINILPLEAVRRRTFRYASSPDDATCTGCDDPVEPAPDVCDLRQLFDFKNSSTSLDFISLAEPAMDFACGAFQPTGLSFVAAVHVPSVGIQISNQTNPATKALGIWKAFDAYNLCQLHVPIITSTGRLNTRAAAVWTRDALGVWSCLASQSIAIYKNGEIALIWAGSSITITGIAVVGAVGGGQITVTKIDMNYGVLPA